MFTGNFKVINEILDRHGAQYFLQYGNDLDANFYYATGFSIPDPVLHIVGKSEDYLIVHEFEKNRAKRESRVKKIISLSETNFYDILKKKKDAKKALVEVYIKILSNLHAKKILVPENFPSFILVGLMKNFDVEVVKNIFSELRAVKNDSEIRKIENSSIAAIKALNYALRLLKRRKSNIRCEKLREKIELYLFKAGYIAENTIVSSGKKSSDPHFIGKGKIQNHVVIDIFPKSKKHRYYSDFTRTIIVKYDSSIVEMLKAVIDAKNAAISKLKNGVKANEIHNTVCDILEERGFKTTRSKSKVGFIHSTGHGVGLQVHEEPKIFENEDVLKKGMVVTIEPGLYYPEVGGVRVEDTVLIRKNDCKVLTPFSDFISLEKV